MSEKKTIFQNGTKKDSNEAAKTSSPPEKESLEMTVTSIQLESISAINSASTPATSKRHFLGRCCCTQESSKSVVTVGEIIFVCICVVVAMGFCVPVIIYAVDSDRSSADNSTLDIEIDIDNCSSAQPARQVSQQCLMLRWSHSWNALAIKSPVVDHDFMYAIFTKKIPDGFVVCIEYVTV